MTLFRLFQVLTAATFLAGPVGAHAMAPLAVSQHPAAPTSGKPGKPSLSGMNDPYLVACLNALGHGEFSRGEEACTQALLIDPKDPDALELRGYAFLLEQRFDKAERDLRAALQVRPRSAELYAGYGRSLTGLGDFSAAVASLIKAVDLEPSNAAYRNALCWARAGSGKDLDMALGDCDTALMLAPGAAGPLNSHGLVNLRLGRFSDAIADYTASLAISAAQPSARFGRGLAHLALGQAAAGTADILTARAGDSDIDAMFIQMGILPKDCGATPDPKCPAGFPPPQKSGLLVARWRVQP